MNIIKYRPTRNLLDWDFDTLFDNFFYNDLWSTKGQHYPSVDVKEDENQYVLEADLPGVSDKDLEVKVEENLLTISSQKQEEKKTDKEGYLIRERKGYSFCRSFVLPKDVDKEKIEANFKDGVLKLTLAKSPETKPKQIEIKTK